MTHDGFITQTHSTDQLIGVLCFPAPHCIDGKCEDLYLRKYILSPFRRHLPYRQHGVCLTAILPSRSMPGIIGNTDITIQLPRLI